jgi:CAAX protease family protein
MRRGALIGLAVAIAPVVEEVLFRGWLWTDLRRYWSATSIMLFTGLVFVLLHVADDFGKIYTLLPLTVILSLARHCGSVKATIWLHLLNNAAIAGALLYRL